MLTKHRKIFLVAITFSILLSFWFSLRQTVLNPDAICYILAAKTIATDGVRQAMALCGQAKWPFYSILIHYLAAFTPASYIDAANIWNGVFSLLSVVFFLLLIQELGANKSVMWFAAAFILLAHQFNHVRIYIIRDHGYWAFSLLSLLLLLKAFGRIHETKKLFLLGLSFALSLTLAALFRIEGVIFLVALPFLSLLLLRPFKTTFTFFLGAFLPILLMGFLILIALKGKVSLGRMPEISQQLQMGFLIIYQRFMATKTVLVQSVLNTYSIQDANIILMLAFLGWYVVDIIKTFTFVASLLLIYALTLMRPIGNAMQRRILSMYIVINIFITSFFLLENYFLSKRYLMALCLLLMLWLPFALNDLYARAKLNLQYKIIFILLSLALILSGTTGIYNFSYSKLYIKEAGLWLKNNVPTSANLYMNDPQLMFYSEHYGNNIFNRTEQFRVLDHAEKFDYLALRLAKEEKNKALPFQTLDKMFQPIKTFSEKNGDSVVIFQGILKK